MITTKKKPKGCQKCGCLPIFYRAAFTRDGKQVVIELCEDCAPPERGD